MKRPERPAAKPDPKPRATPRVEERRAAKPVDTPRNPAPTRIPMRGFERRPEPVEGTRAPTARAPRPAGPEPERSARAADRLRQRYEKAEVKRFTRRARRRRLGWATAFGVVGLIVALIGVAIFSPILALREIRVEGASRLDPAVVSDALSGQLGTPLALLDDGRIRDELGRFTTIRSYVTELVPPGTLVVHVVERSPLGLVTTAQGFDVVDAAGVVLESSATRPEALPLLQLDEGGVGGRAFSAITEVLVALPPEVLAQVDSITARTRDDVTLTLAGSSQRVVWGGAADSERKAAVFAALLAMFAGSGTGEYDLSAPDNPVFRPD